ncbi:MAG: transporter ATP-binding protein [Ramlibacter sp.]|nr:transporter ATP-binding protein [Ramlibacter sp.]
MLEVANLQVNYGAAPALWDVSIRVDRGELVCVVGPNGAGKSTLINVIAGLHRARGGRLAFDGQDITQLASHRFCAAGIAVVPEGRRLFTGMSVRDNLELGSYLPEAKAHRADSMDKVLALFPALQEKLRSPAGALSGGQQQMVAIGRALMSRPQLLLLDEPSLGLAPMVVVHMFKAIQEINASARRAYVMEEGRIVADGLASDLVNRPEIRKAYLGLEH